MASGANAVPLGRPMSFRGEYGDNSYPNNYYSDSEDEPQHAYVGAGNNRFSGDRDRDRIRRDSFPSSEQHGGGEFPPISAPHRSLAYGPDFVFRGPPDNDSDGSIGDADDLLDVTAGGPLLPKTATGIGKPRELPMVFEHDIAYMDRLAVRLEQPEMEARPRINSTRNERGFVVDVSKDLGRILVGPNFNDHGAYVYFDRNTCINGHPVEEGVSLAESVPLGAKVQVKLTWNMLEEKQQFSSKMAYYCERINFNPFELAAVWTKPMTISLVHEGMAIAEDSEGNSCLLHPILLRPKEETWKRLLADEEIQPRIKFGPQCFGSERELEQVVFPGVRVKVTFVETPPFIKKRALDCRFVAVHFETTGPTSTCFGELVDFDEHYCYFDSLGTRNSSRDDRPVRLALPTREMLEREAIMPNFLEQLLGLIFLLTVVPEFPDCPWDMRVVRFRHVCPQSVPFDARIEASCINIDRFHIPKRNRRASCTIAASMDDDLKQFSFFDPHRLTYRREKRIVREPDPPVELCEPPLDENVEDALHRGLLNTLRGGVPPETPDPERVRVRVREQIKISEEEKCSIENEFCEDERAIDDFYSMNATGDFATTKDVEKPPSILPYWEMYEVNRKILEAEKLRALEEGDENDDEELEDDEDELGEYAGHGGSLNQELMTSAFL